EHGGVRLCVADRQMYPAVTHRAAARRWRGSWLSRCLVSSPSPPTEEATARQDQAGQASTSDGAGNIVPPDDLLCVVDPIACTDKVSITTVAVKEASIIAVTRIISSDNVSKVVDAVESGDVIGSRRPVDGCI